MEPENIPAENPNPNPNSNSIPSPEPILAPEPESIPVSEPISEPVVESTIVLPKSQKTLFTILIVIIIILLGIVGYKFLVPGSTPAEPDGQANVEPPEPGSIIKKGSEVEPVLQQTVINAFLKQKALFASGNIPEIRKYLVNGSLPEDRERVSTLLASTTDADLKNYIVPFNTVMNIITVDMLKSAEATWTFGPNMDKVRIVKAIPPGNPDGIKMVTIDLVKNNGVWY